MASWKTVPLRGPNRWSLTPTLEAHIESKLANLAATQSASIASQLQSFLDSKQFTTSHPQSVENATRLVPQIGQAATRAILWLLTARWFSAMSGVPTREFDCSIQSRRSSNLADEEWTVLAIEMEEEQLSQRCFEMADEMIECVGTGREFPLPAKFRELFDYADDVRLGPSSLAILRAAKRRNIPYFRLNRGSLVQLGEGRHLRRIWTAETDATSAIAESIASDKDLTKRFLRQVGVPVPIGRTVTSADDAWSAAKEIGFPVVVKPCNANHQRGISIELYEREEILKAYDWAVLDGETNDILVEQFARGQHHRLLVIGNRLIAAARGHSEGIVGNGIDTVQQLVDYLNRDPRRGEAYTDPLGVVKLDAAAIIELTKQNLTIDSIPERDREVIVRRCGDLTTDCTDAVHPKTAEQAVLAARVIGLDIAGLDVLATDISQPLEQQSGAVVEVNAGPSLSPHVTPLFGKPRRVGDAIVEMLFPNHRSSQIEIMGIVSGCGSDLVVQEIAGQLANRSIAFGLLKQGITSVSGRVIDTGCRSDEERVTALLCNPTLHAILVQVELETVAELGSCVPRVDRLIIATADDSMLDDPEMQAGLLTMIHAVPIRGTIECRDVSESVAKWIRSKMHVEATLLTNAL